MEETGFSENRLHAIVGPLLAWYDENARVLPWRENIDPYRVWVSEIMLQQTQVETVVDYYNRFMAELPDIKSLADIEEGQLLKLWEGLGYYSRARNLHKAARVIMEKYNGRFPEVFQDILALPGVGRYTAGAIASICFCQPIPAVDGNVLRVVARLTGDASDIASPEMKEKTGRLLGSIYPDRRCGDFTQSLMELGAVLCRPNAAPKCQLCPLAFFCQAYQKGEQAALPVKAKRKPRKLEKKTVFLLLAKDQVAVRQREAKAMLGKLWEFPNVEGVLDPAAAAEQLAQWGLEAAHVTPGPEHKHVFTHVEWEMTSYVAACVDTVPRFRWVTRAQLAGELALPTAFQAFFKAL